MDLLFKQIQLIFFLGLVFLIQACGNRKFETEKDMINYLVKESSGYLQQKTVNGYQYVLMYKPTDLLVNQELKSEYKSKEKLDELRNKYKKYLYFNLSISKNNQEILSVAPKDRNEFGVMVNQLAFGMSEKVHMYTQSKDTIEMADYIYPRMYGMSKSTNMLFVYPREKAVLDQEYLNFTIEDLGLYTGEIKFKIQTKKIKNQPELSF